MAACCKIFVVSRPAASTQRYGMFEPERSSMMPLGKGCKSRFAGFYPDPCGEKIPLIISRPLRMNP